MTEERCIAIGVLALQGSFQEHVAMLNELPNVQGREVRTKEELHSVDALIIPGGESTTMALIAERWGLIPDLKEFAAEGYPIWGTCAGLIFLADKAIGQKEGGQALLGGLDCLVQRNFFGSQINSFTATIAAPPCLKDAGRHTGDFQAVFIRAPAVMEAGEGVEVIAEYQLTPEEQAAAGRKCVAVAVRKGLLLATAFHPELTDDLRWHQMFAEMARRKSCKHPNEQGASAGDAEPEKAQPMPTVEDQACSSSATSEGWEHIVSDDFSVTSVEGKEAKIYYEDRLVARAVLSGSDVELRLESSLQGKRCFPFEGLVRAFQKAQAILKVA